VYTQIDGTPSEIVCLLLDALTTTDLPGTDYRGRRDVSGKQKGWVCHSLYIALFTLFNFNTFDDAMHFVIGEHPGSDTDTNASITGALFGALLGYENMNKEFYTSQNIKLLESELSKIYKVIEPTSVEKMQRYDIENLFSNQYDRDAWIVAINEINSNLGNIGYLDIRDKENTAIDIFESLKSCLRNIIDTNFLSSEINSFLHSHSYKEKLEYNIFSSKMRAPPIVISFDGFWTSEDCKNNRTAMFIFGDNDRHFGKKGQAVIRDEPNAYGIPTKKYPSLDPSSYYTDDEYEENIRKIDTAFNKIIKDLDKYDMVYLPSNGVGTGLADLQNKAPKTLEYINNMIATLTC
jgi:hypothetical protein